MGKRITAYKVLRVAKWERLSYSAPPPGCLRYYPGQKTSPPPRCGPLAVFDTIESAKKFLESRRFPPFHYKLEIWEGEAEEAEIQCEVWVPGSHLLIQELPKGTVLVRSFIPKRLVYALQS